MNTIKNLQLLNTYSTHNVGDAAIYASICTMAKELGFNQFSFKKLIDVNELSEHIGHEVQNSDSRLDLLQQYLAVGGDIFNNARPLFLTKQFIVNISELRKSPKRTTLFGQSIPRSCQGISFRVLAMHLRALSCVCVRDQESYDRLRDAKINARMSYDTAFASLPKDEHLSQVKALNIPHIDRLALISLRSFDHLYPQDSQKFIQELVLLIKRFKSEGLSPAILLQSKVSNSDSDLALIRKIQLAISVDVIDPFELHRSLPQIAPWQIAQAITVLATIAVGVRYHTSVFRLTGGKMPFNLYYSNKGEDLTNRLAVPGIGVSDFSVDTHFDEIMKTKDMQFDAALVAAQVRNDFAFSLGFNTEKLQRGQA